MVCTRQRVKCAGMSEQTGESASNAPMLLPCSGITGAEKQNSYMHVQTHKHIYRKWARTDESEVEIIINFNIFLFANSENGSYWPEHHTRLNLLVRTCKVCQEFSQGNQLDNNSRPWYIFWLSKPSGNIQEPWAPLESQNESAIWCLYRGNASMSGVCISGPKSIGWNRDA